ncbi:LuxR C-terminal-related transcriptional regulator [Candidatus Solirubrobacter pratensis]|uniref:LuxR C-terminal-related transcriptional regulator n=1 Tax=Candidatus Solirubrobacter pratensis TaxID=1298857 RepID=UPI00048246DA|nr:LuxR C-terminal-related transcriptional regulator [Candidatus Solirubrobacter pratensis]
MLPRADLVAALERATTHRVTVISAPPGSGKTFLLRQWADVTVASRRVVTVAVRRGERNAQAFLLALLQAIVSRLADGVVEPEIAATPEFDPAAIVERILEALVRMDDQLVIVIDDVHELDAPEAYSALKDLIERLPPDVRVVLSSRRDPRLRLHHLRLEGELVEIRASDLRLRPDETKELLAGAGVDLAEADAAILHERTEGWAAGVRLAAIALADHPDPGAFVAAFSGSDRTVSEYLLAEMLERQPEESRRLLLRTSIVDRVNGSLADVLTGGVGSEATFRALEDANAFVVSLDPGRTWFRYHHLFGDLLRLELRRTAPDEIAELHRRAATWLEEHGLPVEAVRHAQAAEDWPWATRLLVDHALSLSLDGEQPVIEALLKAFPPAALDAHSELAIVLASDQLERGSLLEAEGYLAVAEREAASVPAERRSRFDVALAAAKVSLARRRGDFTDVMKQVELLARRDGVRSSADVALGGELRAVALMDVGIVEMWSLRLDEARDHLLEAAELAHRIGRRYLEVAARAHLGFASNGSSFALGRERCAEAIALADTYGWGRDHVIAVALAAYAGVLTFSGEYARAEALLETADTALRPDVEPATALLLRLSRGMWCCGTGRWGEAVAQFRAGEQMQALLVTQHALAAQLRGFRVAAQVRIGLLDEARSSVANIERDDPLWGESLTAVATVRLAEEKPQEALDALAAIFAGNAPIIHEFTAVQAKMLAARAWVELADRAASEAAVEDALDLAERDRLVLPFTMADGGELLARHPRHGTAHAKLLTDVVQILEGGVVTEASQVDPLSEPLSRGELRVLGHLPSNLSAPEIAAELFVSANTVKTHMRHIYRKLGAHNRSEAVRRARELGLLSRRTR